MDVEKEDGQGVVGFCVSSCLRGKKNKMYGTGL